MNAGEQVACPIVAKRHIYFHENAGRIFVIGQRSSKQLGSLFIFLSPRHLKILVDPSSPRIVVAMELHCFDQ